MLRIFFALIALFTWALWLGGMIALFVFVQTLFGHNRDIAVQAAPMMFLVFQKYQLILAAIALVALVGCRIASPSKAIYAVFILFALAAFGAVAVSIWILPPMEHLRSMGESSSPQFKRLHGESMMLYCGEVLMLLIGGIMLILSSPGKSTRTAPATDSPA